MKTVKDKYKNLLSESEKHFFVSGNIDVEKVKDFFNQKFEKEDIIDTPIIRTKKSELKFTSIYLFY